jgi:hypothetical protein
MTWGKQLSPDKVRISCDHPGCPYEAVGTIKVGTGRWAPPPGWVITTKPGIPDPRAQRHACPEHVNEVR